MTMVTVTQPSIEALYRKDHVRLFRALYAFTGDREIASDAEIEAFTQALGRGDNLHDPAAWIWRSAFRIAGGMLKHRHDGPTPVESTEVIERTDLPAIEAPVIELLDQLDGLSEQQRAVVVLRYVGQFSPTEIADFLDSTPGSVRVQLHRAHQQLRRDLEA